MSDSETNSSDFFEPGSAFLHPIGDLLGVNGQSNTFSRVEHAILQDSDSDDNLGDDLFDDGNELDPNQCCRCSRNTAKVTPKIIYFYYQKKNFLGQSTLE